MIKIKGLIVLLSLLLISGLSSGQQITVSPPTASACPNQSVQVSLTWNNVTNTSYSLITPPGGPAVQVPPTFTLVQSAVGVYNYTVIGAGSSNTGPVTSTVAYVLTVNAAAALSITNTPSSYCPGASASFTVNSGGSNYVVTGGCAGNLNSSSNIILIPNLNSGCAGVYTVATTINGCARTGTTQVNVAPATPIAMSANTAVCQGGATSVSGTLATGNDWQWMDNNGNAMPGQIGSQLNLNGLTINQSGVYTLTANINYNPNGTGNIKCPRTNTVMVTVIQTFPVTAGASPNNVLCQGSVLNFNATAGTPSGWTWSGPQSFFSTAQNPVISPALPIHSGNYSVTALFIGGATTCTTGAVVNVSIVPVTQPVITMVGSVCDKTTNYTMSVNAGTNAMSYNWSGPCIQVPVGPVTTIDTCKTNCSGVYYASAKFQIGSTQCISTASAALNVVPVNSITVVNPAPVCSPDNAYLQSNAPGANLFTWVGPQGYATPGANVVVYNPTPLNSGIYTVTAYFGGGNLTCINTNTVQLTVNPVMHFSLTPRQEVCYNTSITVAGPAGATSYTWTSSTGYTSNNKDLFLPQVQPKHTGHYTLSISLGPCITKEETELVVLDPVDFTLTPSSKTICRGDTIVMEAGLTGGSQNYAYVWNPALYLDSPNGPKKELIPTGSVLYQLMAYDIACPNFTRGSTTSITVNQPPVPTLTLSQGEGCVPFCMYLNTNTQKDAAITTYDFGGLLQIQRDNFNYCLTKPGTYNLKIYSKGKNGCGGTYEYPYPIVVYERPGADFYMNPEVPTSVDKVTFVPTASYDPIVSYYWQFQGGTDLNDTSSVITPTSSASDESAEKNPLRMYNQAGKYPVMLISTTDQGCVDTVYKSITITDDLNVYIPNTFTPNGDGLNDVFYIKGTGMKSENFSLDVVNRWGSVIFHSNNINEGWDGKIWGQVAPDGTYTVYVKVVGMNGEGRKEITAYVNLIK